MAYEIFTRKVTRTGNPALAFNTFGRIGLNQAATRLFQKDAIEFVLLLWDTEERKLAIRPITKKDTRAYRIAYSKKGNGSGFSAKTFFDYIGLDYSSTFSVLAQWNEEEGLLEADVPQERLKDLRQQKLLPVEPNRKIRTA